MSNVKSLDALDINGLAIFKENIVKKYLTPGAAPSVVSQAVYRALQQYKKDAVRFYSAFGNLPVEGNPGTIYLVHKSVDSEHTQIPGQVPKDEIWISSASNEAFLGCRLGSSYVVNAKKHDTYPFHVLKLADIDPARVTFFSPYQRSANNQGYDYHVYLPDTTTTITTYAQLASLAGKIIAVPLRNEQRNTTILPQLAYSGTIPDKWNVPSDEIWVLSNQDSITVQVDGNGWGINNARKNEYGFFVLKKGVHFPSTANTNIYPTYIGSSNNAWYNAKDKGMSASLESTNDLEYLYGHIVTRSFINANYPLWVVYSYQVAEKHIEYTDDPPDVPADEIWFDPMDWSNMYVSYTSSTAGYVQLEKNSYGYYVLPESMIPSSASCMYLSSVNSDRRSGDLEYHEQNYNTCVIRELCDGRSPCNQISNVEQIYEFLGKCMHVTPGHSSALQIDYALPENVTVPDTEVWIDPHNWGNADKLYLLNGPSIYRYVYSVRTLSKNAYGYYVLTDLDTLPSAYLIISKDSAMSYDYYSTGTANSTLYLLYSKLGVGGMFLEKEYFQTVARGKIITTAPHSAIVAQVVGKVANMKITYVTPTVPVAEDTADNKFVAYTYKNGKYVQVSSSLFDMSDLHLDEITDQVLDLTSTNPISNKAVCDGLRYKYDIANILATPVAGYDNIVSSSGIKAALDRLVTWDDIECIPITGEEIHTLFATYKPIPLIAANYYRIVIRGKKVEGANYLAKIFETETLTGLTFVSRSADGPSMSETLSFTEDDTGKYIPVTVTCANKYNSPSQFWPGNLFDESSDGYYRADTSDADMVLTIDIKRKLAMSTLRKLTFTCLAGRPYQTTIPPVEKLTVSVYGSIGGVDYPTFRENIVYTPNKVANDGVYTIDIFPNA